ncbi:MAG TPA: alpha/beta hydrolase [Pyrinomonadaceae bacterium]|nr:alpha/beta hydrolase [Pyrinomonadaceae bacterium]
MITQPRRTNLASFNIFQLLVSALLLISLGGIAAADEVGESLKVERLTFPVTLSNGSAADVVGYLYYKGSFRDRTLLVAIHGATYNHKYWDVPIINGHEYSFARYMAESKYAVLAIDQLGTGESTRPDDGDLLTVDQTASTIHQVITQLRTGEGGVGYPFARVVTVGHSLGAINAIYEQGTYHDADAVVSTGMGHVPHELPIPAELINGMLQYEYSALPPEVRTAAFYYAPGADPDVITYDNNILSDLLARGQLLTGIIAMFDPAATRVGATTGPVLVQLGEFDVLFPASLGEGEAAYFTSASSVTVQSLAGVGHDFNTHFRNHAGWRLIDEWLQSQGLGRVDE